MASARELLEQADALMRKNRSRGDGDIPLLTDAVALVPVPVAVTKSSPAVAAVPMAPAAPADVPLLTDVVEQPAIDFGPSVEPPAALVAIMEGDPSDWLVMDTVDPASHSITGRAPDTLAVVPPMTLKAAGSQATPPPMGSQPRAEIGSSADMEPDWASLSVPLSDATAASLPIAAPIQKPDPVPETVNLDVVRAFAASAPEPDRDFGEPVDEEDKFGAVTEINEPVQSAQAASVDTSSVRAVADDERWRALAEQVSMQVLQRLDLFTDTGLKDQLAHRLQPIVERASAELVGEITDHVGRLIRTYVSEAIEREIADWKRDQQ